VKVLLKILLLIYAALTITCKLSGQNLFDDSTILNLELKFEIEQVHTDVGIDPSYHDGEIAYLNEDGAKVSFPAKVKTRGIFRKKPSNCSQPPLMLKFKSGDTNYTIFEGIDKVKLVVPCKEKYKYQNLILREYLVYKLYQIISPYAYKVRLLNLKMIDANSYDSSLSYAFLIEPTALLAKRLGGTVLERKNYHPNACNRKAYNKMAVFQFMIGHTDWSIKALHNIKLIELEPYAPPIPIPFDFDFSGFVNAPYTLPAEHLPINSVKERHFNGYCRPAKEYIDVFYLFIAKRDTIRNTISTFTYLPEKERKILIKYIDEFYDVISSDSKRKSKILSKCRTD
jgi:hypothetical protein